jgi:DNA-binding CsgD family transcriptional regulator/MFS family permease
MHTSLFKPNVASFGYALLLAINATSIWGGAFPLLPLEFQTFNVTVTFFLVQSVAFWGTFFFSVAGSYFFPAAMHRALALSCGPLLLLGSVGLIAPLYIPALTIPLVVIGGVFLGVGSAGFFMLWQRVFASQTAEKGNLHLIVGTGFSALVYGILHLIPIAVAAFTIPLIFVPLCGLCLILATRTVDTQQPMFEDIPRQNPHVYLQVIRNNWRSALCVGSFGFTSGIARALALEDPSMGPIVNFASMGGALISALVLIFLWQRYSFRFDTVLSFRTTFPLIVTSFLLFPFIGASYLRIFAGFMYMLFTFATMIMMIQCAQASRDHGISPTFIYGFFGGIVYGLQSVGFLTGYLSAPLANNAYQQLAVIALLSVWFLAITLYFVRGHFRHHDTEIPAHSSSIEFIALKPLDDGGMSPPALASLPSPPRAPSWTDSAAKSTADSKGFRDRISKQCALLVRQYRLTARESEVMELIARGNSVAHIAETLIVSENTIRTHSKRLYVKLNIHKRQELLALLEELG